MTVDGVTTDFILDGQNVIADAQNGSITSTYFNSGDGVAYSRDATGQIRWYIFDGLGSVLAEVNADGKINPDTGGNDTHLIRYDVFGGIRNYTEVADGESSHRFVGSLGHTSEGDGIISEGVKYPDLIYMRARYYDPSVGRFVSEDPARDGTNWYVYCENNPVNAVDPNGSEVSDAEELIAMKTIETYMDIFHKLMAGGLITVFGGAMMVTMGSHMDEVGSLTIPLTGGASVTLVLTGQALELIGACTMISGAGAIATALVFRGLALDEAAKLSLNQ